MKTTFALLPVLLLGLPCLALAEEPAKEEWIQLFNGKDLDGWIPKIRYSKVGENYNDTFRVADGLLTVSYDKYDEFGERFGHLFYKKPFSHYRLRVEYRFIGEQVKGGPGWAIRNSGIMIHGQTPESMGVDQDFPNSIESQLLGGSGSGTRTTGNVCTPGTHIVMKGKLIKQHCISSASKTYHGDQWVTIELEVHGNRLVRHLIDGEVIFEYANPQLDAQVEDPLLHGGTISLQSESHPVQFRKVEILELKEE